MKAIVALRVQEHMILNDSMQQILQNGALDMIQREILSLRNIQGLIHHLIDTKPSI
jgi:hypothetical protein